MKLGVLFSGGKDSTYAAWLAKGEGHELACLVSVFSKNPDSYMFHTPAIELTKKQAELMDLPLLIKETIGNKEEELADLEDVLVKAKEEFSIGGVVSGVIASNYQKERIEKICVRLGLKCFSPLSGRGQIELLDDLISNNFHVLISAVAAFPLDKSWVGRKIDLDFVSSVKILGERYGINPAGEGGEFESLVINCPLFRKGLDIKLREVIGSGNAWRGVFESVR